MREIFAGQLLPGIAKINPVAPEQRAMLVALRCSGSHCAGTSCNCHRFRAMSRDEVVAWLGQRCSVMS
jgi:hypothetical protein